MHICQCGNNIDSEASRLTHVTLLCMQSLYSAVDDLRDMKADKEQLEIEVKEVHTYMYDHHTPAYSSLGKIVQ